MPLQSKYFTYTVIQEPDPAGLEESGYIPLEAIVCTAFLKKDGTLKQSCGPYMAFYPGFEPPSDVIERIMAVCDERHDQQRRQFRRRIGTDKR